MRSRQVGIPMALEERIDAKLRAFEGRPNDDTTHRAIVHVIEEELLRWQRELPDFVIPTPHVAARDRAISITYTEHTGDESTPAKPSTIDAVRFMRVQPAPEGPELPPEPVVPSAIVFVVCRGRALVVDYHGTDLAAWIELGGMRDALTEIDATARPDGAYVWRGRYRTSYSSHTNEHDAWLDGTVEPLTDEELEMIAEDNGDPWHEAEIEKHVQWAFQVAEIERSDFDRVKEALTDYAHASGRRVQPVHEVAAACDADRREAVQARDAALEELVAIRAALGIPGGMNTIAGLEALLAGVRRVLDVMRDGFEHVIGAMQPVMPDDEGMTDTTDPADVKAKADQVLALLEREPASHATTEILAREVRRLRAELETRPIGQIEYSKTIAFIVREVICELVHRRAAGVGFVAEHPVRELGIRAIPLEPLLRLAHQGEVLRRMSDALAGGETTKYAARDLAAVLLDTLDIDRHLLRL